MQASPCAIIKIRETMLCLPYPPHRWDTAGAGIPRFEASFEGHTDWVNDVLVLPSSDAIVSCSNDCTVRAWRGSGQGKGHSNGGRGGRKEEGCVLCSFHHFGVCTSTDKRQ
jgi:WD40 repeat protein